MPRTLWTPRAERHVENIAYYIAVEESRPLTAEETVRKILAKCNLYAANPQLGTARPDLGATCRAFRHKRWVVIYEPLEDGIVVEAVFDATRAYPRLFRQGE